MKVKKRFKKCLAFLLSLTMILSMSMMASAAEESTENAGTLLTAVKTGPVATIGGTQYDTLAEAIAASKEGDTITLLADIDNSIEKDDYNGALNHTLKAGTTLDGASHTISGDVSIYIPAAGGTVQNVNFKNIHNSASNRSAVYASGLTGTLTITGCEFDTCDWDAIQTTPKAGAVIDIQENTFRNTGEKGINTRRYVHVESGQKVDFTVTVTKNKFYDGTKLKETALEVYYPVEESKVKLSHNYINEPMSSCIIMNSYSSANRKPELALPFADETLIQEIMPEADIVKSTYNYYYYPTLEEAINAASNGATIRILSNIDREVIIDENKSLTLDLSDDKSIKNITNNGTLTLSSGMNDNVKITNNGTLKITGGEIYNLNKISGDGKVVISGGTFTAKPADSMLADWYTAKEQADGNYKVSKMNFDEARENGMVASSSKPGGVFYKSITDAMNNSRVYTYLQKDSEEEVLFNTGTYRTFYLNGNVFAGSILMGDTLNYVSLYDGSAVLKNVSGKKLNVGAASTSADVTIKDASLGTLNIGASGDCKIQGGTYDKVIVNEYYQNKTDTVPANTAKLNITGGTFASDKVTIEYTNHTLDDGTTSKEVPLSDYVPAGYQVVDNGDGTYSVKKEMTAPTGIQGVNETVKGKNNGKITGLDATKKYQISSDDGQTWKDAAVENGIITNLTPGTYLVRYAETAVALASETTVVTVGSGAEPTYTLSILAPAFSAVDSGYKRPEAKAITINSTGNSDATIASVTVDNRNAFEILGSGKTVAAGGTLKTWLIQPKTGLKAGTYHAEIKVTYNTGAIATAKVSFQVNDPVQKPVETVTKADIEAGTMALNKKIKATWSKNNIAVTWGKVSKADGYEVYAAKCGNKYSKVKTVKGNKTFSYTIKKINGKKLNSKVSYKIYVKAYRTINGKKKYVGTSYGVHTVGSGNKTYTNAKSLKVSKKSVTLKKGKTKKVSVTIKKQSNRKKLLKSSHIVSLRYFSTNTKVATVTKGGTIKGVGKGTCTIYVLAANGVKTTIKVTVK